MQQADDVAGKVISLSRFMLGTTLLFYALVAKEPAVKLRDFIYKVHYEATTNILQMMKDREYRQALQETLPTISQVLYRLPRGSVEQSNARDVAPMIAAYLYGPSFQPYRTYTQDRNDLWNSQKEQDERSLQARQFRQKFPAYLCTAAHVLWCIFALRTAIAVINRMLIQPFEHHQEEHDLEPHESNVQPDNPEDDPNEEPLFLLLYATFFFWQWNQGLLLASLAADD